MIKQEYQIILVIVFWLFYKYFDGDYFKECLIEYGINKVSYPIGTARKDNLMILLTEENEFYCFTDGCLIKVGDCIEDMLDCLVGECREAEILVN